MKIVIKNGVTLAWHHSWQDLTGIADYLSCLILTVPDGTPVEIGQPWPVTLEQAKEARTLEAAAACTSILAPLKARFPEDETKTWQKQLKEAHAILGDGITPGDVDPTREKYPAIGTIIARTGETWQDFAMAVQANDERWTAIVSDVAGQRQALVAKIKACGTVADVLAVDMTITLPVEARPE